MCGVVYGLHCGSRYNDGYITGDCDFDTIYFCPAPYFPAFKKEMCGYCENGDKPGADYCSIGRHDKLKNICPSFAN